METMEFDPSRYFRDEEECCLYLADMMNGGEPGAIQKAIADVVRALKADVDPVYVKQLQDGTADFETVVMVLHLFNWELTVKKG
jgi:DNA-binding phage protein